MTDLQMQRPKLLHTDEDHPAIPSEFSALYYAYDEHKIVAGETLASIGDIATQATGRQWTWRDIAKYNWNTTNYKEVQWYLWHHVGCRNVVEAADGTKSLFFNGQETPGIIYVPKKSLARIEPAPTGKGQRAVGKVATSTVGAPKQSGNAVKVNKDYVLLFDTNSGMLYRVPQAMYKEMRTHDKLLRKLQQDQAAAQKAGKDQQNNAVTMSRKELHDYCGVTETTKDKAASSGSPGSLFDGEGIIREFVPLQSKEFVYVPAKKQKEIEDKASFKDRWKKGAVKDALQMRADSRTAKANEPKTSAMKKERPLEFKIESDWKAEGAGSLLDMMDTGDPRNCWWLFANPVTLPAAMLDYVGEKFPGFLRKNHGGQWDWAKTSKYFDGGYEARFARYSYNAQAFELTYNTKEKTFKLGGKAGGSIDLFRGKTHLSWLVPEKDGVSANKDLGLPIKSQYKGKDFSFRIAIVGTVSGFIGATAELSYEAAADWSLKGEAKDGSKKCPVAIGLGGGLNAFAGAEVKGELSIAVEWKNTHSNKWASLAKTIGSVSGYAGVAAQFIFKVGWDPKKKKFVLEYKMGVALKFGGAGALKAEVSVNEILELIGAMLEYVDYHKLGCITADAFEAFTNYMIAMAVEQANAVTSSVSRFFDDIQTWWNVQGDIHDLALSINKHGLPASVKRLASPEAKAGLIRKLCMRSSLFSDEAEENAVILILRTVGSRSEMIHLLEHIDLQKRTTKGGVDMMLGLLDFSDEARLQAHLNFWKIRV